MSAERLRDAAALMRERAEAVTSGPWTRERYFWKVGSTRGMPDEWWVSVEARGAVVACMPEEAPPSIPNATHIASWDPAVALAVADWLDTAGADLWAHGPLHCAEGCVECDDDMWMPHVRRALAVADAYLGGPS